MPKTQLITGRVIPERKSFGHDSLRLYVKDPEKGIDICLLLGVINNQLVAKVIGDAGEQSNVFLKNLVTQAEQIVLSAVAFTTGNVFDIDIIGVIRDRDDAADGSFNVHYIDNAHDVISNRASAATLHQIYQICISDDGISLCRCLNDLRTALRELNDSPFYCYRAIETIKGHIGDRLGETTEKAQWEVMRGVLGVNRGDVEIIKKLADPLRHGRAIKFDGSEWRKIIHISWDVTEAYIKLLSQISSGEKKWLDVKPSAS